MVRRIASIEDGTNLGNFVGRGAKRKIQPAQEDAHQNSGYRESGDEYSEVVCR